MVQKYTSVYIGEEDVWCPIKHGLPDTSTDLLDAVGQAIVDLSVHPAGCDDWRFYEQLCLEVADRLDIAYQTFKASNATGERPETRSEDV